MASSVDLELEQQFKKATALVQALAGELDTGLLLRLYGLYKQATAGPCTTSQPSWLQPQARRKWDAWHALGQLSMAEAMQGYVRLVSEARPDWEDEEIPTGWVTVSCPVAEPEDHLADEDKSLLDWAKEGAAARVRQLATAGQNVDMWDELGMTPLHWAADRGHLSVVECLLQLGAEPNFKDSEGQTALHYAASCGHVDVLRLLLRKGADPRVQDAEGDRPVDIAASPDIAKLLTV